MELFNIYTIPPFISSILFLFLGCFVLLKNRHSAINFSFFAVCLTTFWWQFSWFILFNIKSKYCAVCLVRIGYIGIIFLPVVFYHFFILFLRRTGKREKIILLISYILTFIFEGLLLFTNYFVSSYYIYFWGYYPKAGWAHLAYLIFLSLLTIWMLFLLLDDFKKTRGKEFRKHNQDKYVISAFVFYIFSASDFLVNYGFEFYPLGFTFILVFLGIIAYAIIRHQLLDIKVVIQRGVIYSVLLSIIVGFYIVLVFLFGLFLGQAADATILLAAGVTTILGIFGVPPIEKLFRRWTDKIFFKDKYDYPQAIYKLSETLNKNIELEILLRSSVTKLKEILKVKKVFFILPEAKLVLDGTEKLEEFTEKLTPVWTAAMESGELPILDYDQIVFFLEDKDLPTPKRQALLEAKKFCQKHKLAMLVPIILEKKLIGLLGLGEKRSGDMFSRDDFNLLKTFSYQAAVAIEKAQLYEQVKNYSEKLEEKVKQRTAKIKGLQEEQKQMMLEIAHGLQTPLTIIKGELNFLKEVVKDKDKIKSLERTIDRTSKFIYDMLRLARLESGAQEFKKEKINLSQLLIDLTEEFKIITEERGIKIISQLEPNLYIFGNMSALEEMITNLVSNSVKYIKEDGEKKIFIYLRKQNKKAEIIIQDTGIGINKEDLFRLFERFYRTRDGRGNTKRGTGLGLAISKRIVEIHRGEIKIKSKINKGTKFVINFPLV